MSRWSKPKHKEIDLVLSSSGVRAPCFIGGVAALEERGYKIKRIAGSSGGAIIAAAYALGIGTEQMRQLSLEIPYKEFRDFRFRNLLSISNPSVYTGKALDDYYKSLFGDATMKDCKIECRIAVVTIIGRKRILITRESHPDMPVWQAVRMSSTIPFIFPWYELDNQPVTDGGLITSMFDIFPDGERPIVSLRPRADNGIKKAIQNVKASKLFLWNYLKIIAEYFLDAVDNQHVPEQEWNRTIIIPTFEIGGFDFEITPDEVKQLIQYGYNAVMVSELSLKL